MASIKESLCDIFNYKSSIPVIILFSIPVFFSANLYLDGKMDLFWILTSIVGVIFYAALTNGLNAHYEKKEGFVTLNPIRLITAILKSFIVLIPYCLVFGGIAWALTTYVTIPLDIPNIQLMYDVLIWLGAGTIIFTAYLTISSTYKFVNGFNLKIVFTGSSEVLLSMIFFIPQIIILNALIVGPLWWLYDFVKMPQTDWSFVLFCSILAVMNVYICADCLSQIASACLKLPDKYYDFEYEIK